MALSTSTVLPTNEAADFYSGFNQEDTNLRSKRLANREAFQKYADQMSQQGKTMGVDDWAALSKDILGPGAWMNVTNPSEQAMSQMASQQAASAQNKAEVMRRDQFKSDQEEKSAILADIHDTALSGKSPAELVQYAQERYGQDLIGKLNLNFDNEYQKAHYQANTEGFSQGKTMYRTADEAKAALADQSWMPQTKKDAIISGAQANQDAATASVIKEAISRGTTGWMGDAADEVGMRSAIRALVPGASKEYEEDLLKQAMSAATSASRGAINKAQVDNEEKVRTAAAEQAPTLARNQLELEAADEKRRLEARTQLVSQYTAQEQAQVKMAADFADKGKMPKGMNTAAAAEAAVGLQSYVFDNPEAYVQAVMSGDKDKIRLMIANSPTMAEHRAKAEALGNLVTNNFASVDEAFQAFKGSGLGVSADSIQKRGREIAMQENIAKTTKPGLTFGQSFENRLGLGSRQLAAVPRMLGIDVPTPTPNAPGEEVARTAQVNADKLRQGFIDSSAAEIKGFRDAMRQNSHVAASAADLQQYEFSMAMNKAHTLLVGMGVNSDTMEVALANSILVAAGTTPTLSRTPLPSERYKTAIEEQRTSHGLSPRTGNLPGASVPSPRAAPPAGGWPAANF